MKAMIATPFIPMSKAMSSHRSAQGLIYADQIKRSGVDITPNMSLEYYYEDFNQFDVLYVYHGNDFSGHLNLFGGMKEFPHTKNFVNFSKFKGKVYSIMIPFFDYYSDLQHKIKLTTDRGQFDEIEKLWWEADWENLKRMQSTAEVIIPNELVLYDNAAMGDSHAICMYRPGWMINSVPFKTLFGALNMGLESFLPSDKIKFKNLEYYFGNIDIRHHLMRQPNPEQATRELVQRYFDAAAELAAKLKVSISIYEPLPIEDPRRAIPKTGWYEKTPFFGTWEERNDVRNIFIDEAIKSQTNSVKLFKWTDKLINSKGELDFKYMEKPKSVHLSREFYPHWQGWEYNQPIASSTNTIMDFFNE